jgi:hypothetical protein
MQPVIKGSSNIGWRRYWSSLEQQLVTTWLTRSLEFCNSKPVHL